MYVPALTKCYITLILYFVSPPLCVPLYWECQGYHYDSICSNWGNCTVGDLLNVKEYLQKAIVTNAAH